MANCLLCSSAITVDAQCYMTNDIGPEITSILERNLGCEIPEDSIICAECFSNIMQDMAGISPRNIDASNNADTLPPETNVCVFCRSSLFRRNTHLLGEGPHRQLILERISPRMIPEGSRVCQACWMHVTRMLQEQGMISSPPANPDLCVWCQRSLAQRRRHSIPEGPERDEIVQRIYPRQIPPGGLVCYACWVSARRNVERERNRSINVEALLEPGPSHSHYNEVCVWCRTSLFRRHTHILRGPEREEVAARIYPSELPEHALVCSTCWSRAQENLQIEQGNLIEATTNTMAMTLDDFSHTTNSSRRCFVPGCQNVERLVVPDYIKKRILKSQKVFVTENARICGEHRSVFNWEFLDQHQFSNTFTKSEMESMLRLSIKDVNLQINFESYHQMDDNLFKYWTGMDKEQYEHLLNVINSAFGPQERPKTALGAYLMKVRTGDSHERISSLLNISKASVTRYLNKVRDTLKTLFVPLHLGLNHLSREDLINRNLTIPKGLLAH